MGGVGGGGDDDDKNLGHELPFEYDNYLYVKNSRFQNYLAHVLSLS